jgi:hypothetical protein
MLWLKLTGELRLDERKFGIFGTLWNAKNRGTFILERGDGSASPKWPSRTILASLVQVMWGMSVE